MQAIKRLVGSRERIDEDSPKWRERAGRTDGPLTYQPGDLIRSLFRHAVSMSHHERDSIYGGSVILVGVAEARGLALPAGSKHISPNAFCTVVPLDASGAEIRGEAKVTRAVASDSPQWDEVLAVATKTDLSRVAGLRVRLRHHESRWRGNEDIGCVDIPLEDLEVAADANVGRYVDAWYPVAAAAPAPVADDAGASSAASGPKTLLSSAGGLLAKAGRAVRSISRSGPEIAGTAADGPNASEDGLAGAAGDSATGLAMSRPNSMAMHAPMARERSLSGVSAPGGAPADGSSTATGVKPSGELRLWVTLHRPPPDPQPIAVHVRVVEAKALLARDSRATAGAAGAGAAGAGAAAAGTASGAAAAFVTIKPRFRVDQAARDGAGHKVAARTRVLEGSLDPAWHEGVLFYDPPRIAAAAAAAAGAGAGAGAASAAGVAGVEAAMAARRRGASLAGGGSDAAVADADAASASAAPTAASLGIAAPRDPLLASQTLAADLSRTHFLTFAVKDKEGPALPGSLGERSLGAVSLSFSDLWGDEDAVISERTLRVQKWFRLTTSARMDKGLAGCLGHLRLDITLCFAEQLLPPGWVEATDRATNASYFYHAPTGVAQWEEPPELADMREAAIAAAAAAAAAASSNAAGASPGAAGAADGSAGSSSSSTSASPAGAAGAGRGVGLHGAVPLPLHFAGVGGGAGRDRRVSVSLEVMMMAAAAGRGAAGSSSGSLLVDGEGDEDDEGAALAAAIDSLGPDVTGAGAGAGSASLSGGRPRPMSLAAVPESDAEAGGASPQLTSSAPGPGSGSRGGPPLLTMALGPAAGSASASASSPSDGRAGRVKAMSAGSAAAAGLAGSAATGGAGAAPEQATATAPAAASKAAGRTESGKAASASGDAAAAAVGASGDGDEDADEAYDADAVAAALANMDPFRACGGGGGGGGGGSTSGGGKAVDFSSPLSGVAFTPGQSKEERMKLMAEALSREKEEKKAAEAAALAAKLRAMSPEERAEHEAASQREARREQRKHRMLQSQFTAYGAGASKARLTSTSGRQSIAATLSKKRPDL